MRDRFSTVQWVALTLVAAALVLWILLSRFPTDPKFEDEPLSYWLTPPHQSALAVRTIGTNGLPLLVSYLRRPFAGSQEVCFQSRALFGFQILGPAAAPVVPELVDMLYAGGNTAANALAFIGPPAVPAIVECLATNRNSKARKAEWARRNCLEALRMIGTNAGQAIPEVSLHLQTFGAAETLASIGRGQPNRVVPMLIGALTNAPVEQRRWIARFIAEFGGEARSALPCLQDLIRNTNYQDRIEASIAIRKVAPDVPDALAPVIDILNHGDVQAQDTALRALRAAASNATEALPAVIRVARTAPQLREPAFDCIVAIGKVDDDVLGLLTNEVMNVKSSVGYKELDRLMRMASRSPDALAAALMIDTTRQPLIKEQLKYDLQEFAREHPEIVAACLENRNDDVRYGAISFLQLSPPAFAGKALLRARSDKNARNRAAADEELVSLFPDLARQVGLKVPNR